MNPSLVSALVPKVASATAALGCSLFLVDCLDTRSEVARRDAGVVDSDVSVDVSVEKAVVGPFHYGMHASVYDNALHHPELPGLLEESGITLLRWPGGGYSDNYHFSNHSMTAFSDGNTGYLGPGTDFGGFVRVAESTHSAIMITVNYGSNLQGDGPGEPKEAAAWVAYANGDPGDEREIGVDGAGNDWLTVGDWASLRASEPEAEDDGLNHLRIAHPAPLGIEYWEIGNEIFGNGFHERYGSAGIELDLHVPYLCEWDPAAGTCSGEYPDCETRSVAECTGRFGHPLLSGTTYGEGVLQYIDAMKAVDPSIKIGAVLGTPPNDEGWMTVPKPVPNAEPYHWNKDVLRACGAHIDFGIVHWYPNPRADTRLDGVEETLVRVADVLTRTRTEMPTMVSMLRESFTEHAGDNAENIELMMTEVGPEVGLRIPRGRNSEGGLDRGQAMGIFAADMYLTAAELGFVNVDWLELHNGTFLNEAREGTAHVKGPAFTGIRMARLLAGPGDRRVSATSKIQSLVAHAAVRADGRVGVLLINTKAPELGSELFTVTLDGVNLNGRGERYDYFPIVDLPADAGAEGRVNARSGTISGPEPFSGMQSPFRLELPPYAVTLLLFDAPN